MMAHRAAPMLRSALASGWLLKADAFDTGGNLLEPRRSPPGVVAVGCSSTTSGPPWDWAFGRADDGSRPHRGDPPKQFAAACLLS